jgi:hypothetical protein
MMFPIKHRSRLKLVSLLCFLTAFFLSVNSIAWAHDNDACTQNGITLPG